jgi:hypothetical protein
MRRENMKNKQFSHHTYQKNARILLIILIVLLAVSCLWIWNPLGSYMHAGKPIAYIYQNGVLLEEIDLDSLHQTYQFTITNDMDQWNEVEVLPGSIGIVHANCPNQLCVAQGFIHNSLLPITCLPHRLVIWVRRESVSLSSEQPMDTITY